MAQHVYITHTPELKSIAIAIGNNIFFNSMKEVNKDGLDANDLLNLASASTTEFFYVIHSDIEIHFPNFDFSFKPPEWDKEYVHIWDDRLTVRLYNKNNVLNNPLLYTDKEITNGSVLLKIMKDNIFILPKSDIVFISYDEASADTNYSRLRDRFPRALRSHGVKGIFEAHTAAATIANTSMVYIVDADAIIEPTFDFSYYPNVYDNQSVHVWYSRNPVNDLIYGYGGVKLFPRQLLLDYTGSPIDFTTSVSKHFKVMHEISNVTQFNTDPFSAWRSGFRECVKLASKLISNNVDIETEARLAIWCSKGSDREFGDFAIMGAKEGAAYGKAHKDQPDMLGLINDYNWLEKMFSI